MKRTMLFILCAVIAVLACTFLAQTVAVMNDVYIESFTLSEDEQTMTIRVGVFSSIGYTRSVTMKEEGNKLQLTFHPAYGFINGKIGANSTFEIPLKPNYERIYIRTDDVFQRGLRRTEDGSWEHYTFNTLPVTTN